MILQGILSFLCVPKERRKERAPRLTSPGSSFARCTSWLCRASLNVLTRTSHQPWTATTRRLLYFLRASSSKANHWIFYWKSITSKSDAAGIIQRAPRGIILPSASTRYKQFCSMETVGFVSCISNQLSDGYQRQTAQAIFTDWSSNSILKFIFAFRALNTLIIVSNRASVKLFSSFEI